MNGRRPRGNAKNKNTETKRDCIMEKFFTINSKRNMKTMTCKTLNFNILENL